MSIDKAVDSALLNADLTEIADSIRAKAGTNEVLSFPSGYVEAIDSIQTGVDTVDATACAEDILYGKTAYVNGAKLEGELRYKKYTGEILSTVVGTDAYAVLAKDDFLKEHRSDEGLSVAVTYDVEEPVAYTVIKNIAFNKSGVLLGWTDDSICQYVIRYDASKVLNAQQSVAPLNNTEPVGVGCIQLTEDGELRMYSMSASNYAIRPSKYTVEVRW